MKINLLLRLVLISLTPLVLAALGVLLVGNWTVVAVLAMLGTALAAWMIQRSVIVPQATANRTKQLLQRRLSLLQAVLDNAPVTMAIKDTQGRYLLANAGYARQFGCKCLAARMTSLPDRTRHGACKPATAWSCKAVKP